MVSPPVCHEPCRWFYGMPRYRQGIVPTVKEAERKLPEASPAVARETNGVQKKFLVFDQSGDQTTVMYSLGVGPSTRYQFPSLNKPQPEFGSHDTVCVDIENEGNDSGSEMREDTEELNALLYSDDETSTGHSPSSMMGSREQKRKIESDEEEEVASSGCPSKRHKKEGEGSLVNTLEDTASSGINCSGNDVNEEEYDNFSSDSMTLRKEKMKETINMIQNLIPGDKNGRNAIMVIDEAISYLISLKVKAKALGLA
ncbi:hypothetical protein QVD17_38328 [Tagetes erecta]|uniref:BHLH domain-containing protein n=1 Tax=Tagetes erecta TaxID=13708 RepID=A0AAD8JRX1_TARER|nr:hypothetical protein QVD17_38328 [Tagetes erecta]